MNKKDTKALVATTIIILTTIINPMLTGVILASWLLFHFFRFVQAESIEEADEIFNRAFFSKHSYYKKGDKNE